jgi:hypothetical protein
MLVITSPALKPLFGTTTDAVPLFGYKFRSYLAINGAVNRSNTHAICHCL